MSQIYAGRGVSQPTVAALERVSASSKTTDALHKMGAMEKHKDGIDLSYIYSLSALTPRDNNATNGIKLSAQERVDIKRILTTGINLTPRETSQIRAAMQESSWLYNQITHMTVKETSGQAYSLGERKLYSGRKPTGRFRRAIGLNGSPYELQETDSYINLSWRDFVNIANLTDPEEFESILAGFFHEALALDLLRVGFNGRFFSPETDPETYPNGEDINCGWHEIAKRYNEGSQVLSDNIQLGPGGDFDNIDGLANHIIETRIPASMRDNPRLVVLVGSELAKKERLRLFDGAVSSADSIAAQNGIERVAGRFAIVPPFMPGKRLAVTTLSNLQAYTQKGSELYREGVDDNREYFWSLLRTEGYGLEDCTMYAAIDEGAISLV